tara:strand:- start:1361 stop:2740 length:1380 start_codon:yes stop_codon:yes gene_type:complete
MNSYSEDKNISDWLDLLSIILNNIETEDYLKLDKILNDKSCERTNFPIFKINLDDDFYKELLINVENNENDAQHLYLEHVNKNFPKNFVFKNNILNTEGSFMPYKILDCDSWRKILQQGYVVPGISYRLYNVCWGFYEDKQLYPNDERLDNVVDTSFKCTIPHLSFESVDIDSIDLDYSESHEITGDIEIDMYFRNNILSLTFPEFDLPNEKKFIDASLSIIERNLQPKYGSGTKQSRQCLFEGCNVYLSTLNTGSFCKNHDNADDPLEYINPENELPIFKDYLKIHFNILDKIEINNPTLWPLIRDSIMNSIFINKRGGVKTTYSDYVVLKFYGKLLPYMRWYIRNNIRNNLNLNNIPKDIEEATIRINSNYEKMNYEFWIDDEHKIKLGCGIQNKLKDKYLLLGPILPCRSKNNKEKYIYKDYRDAMLFIRKNQKIYECPKSLGFHIKTIKSKNEIN